MASDSPPDAAETGRAVSGPGFPWWIPLTFALGWLPGVSAWRWSYGRGRLPRVGQIKTALSAVERSDVLLWGAYSLGLFIVFYLVAFLVRRRGNPSLGFSTHFKELNRRLLFLLLIPFLTALYQSDLEGSRDFITLLFIWGAVGVFGVWVYALARREPTLDTLPSRDPWASPLPSMLPWLVVFGMVVIYGLRFSYLSILDHEGLRTANWDLGIYNNILWNTANGDFLGCSFCRAGKHYTAHFDPILAAFTPLYRRFPRPETLLVIQSFWLALGAVPLFLYARRKLEHSWWAVAIVLVYFLMPALHGTNLYDFHSLALLIPTAIFAIYFLDTERNFAYAVSIAVLLLTREDLALLSLFISFYAWSIGRKRTAVATALVAITYFVAIRLFIMGPVSIVLDADTNTKSYVWYYKELIPFSDEGALGLVISLLTDPALGLMVLFQEPKLLYFLKLMIPLLFLPLIGGRKRIMLLYGMVFIGLATRPYVFSTNFHYSSLLIPFLMLTTVDGVALLRNSPVVRALRLDAGRLQKTLLVTLLFSSALMSTKYGATLENQAFRGGFERVHFTQKDRERDRITELREIVANIAPDAAISADRATGPHLSSRAQLVQWPKIKDADFVVLRSRGKKHKNSKRYKDIIKRGLYVVDYESDEFLVLRRTTEAERAKHKLDKAHQKSKKKGDEAGSGD
ncbi:MAG: DUF2079 domain-containing protein [Myxococcota bacterium]